MIALDPERPTRRSKEDSRLSPLGERPTALRIRRLLAQVRGRARRVFGSGVPSEPPREFTAPPPVVLEKTYAGPRMDAAVARARSNQRLIGVNDDYDLVRANFDYMNFLLTARSLPDPDVDPVRVFLRNGAEAVNSPDINFSMPAYLQRYPQHAHGEERSPYLEWLKRGRDAGEIADPAPQLERISELLGMEPLDVADHLAQARLDLKERLLHGKLGEMIARASEVEPMIGAIWPEVPTPKIHPFLPNVAEQSLAIHDCLDAADFRRARLVLVINRPRWGGGRRMEGHLAHALSDRVDPADIVVIYTDDSGKAPAGRFPDGVREIDFKAFTAGLRGPHARRVLLELIRSFHADAVININSRLFYDLLLSHGKPLSDSERIFLMMFCNEQTERGNVYGYPLRYFYRCFDVVEGVITDSHYLADWLSELYQLDDDDRRRLHVFSAPVDPTLPLVEPRPAVAGKRPQVFWAGRWDLQKRIDVVLDVARRMPDVDFRMWGEQIARDGGVGSEVPPNVSLEGVYRRLTDLELADADVWLYTSAWDGVPGQILEVAMTGVPIVGSLAGGTGEVLHPSESWPVADAGAPEAYEKAIREVLDDPVMARQRARAFRSRMLAERSVSGFAEQTASVLLVNDPQGASDD